MQFTTARSRRESSQAPRAKTRKRFRNDRIREEPVLLTIAMAPLRAGQRSYRFLSSIKGFGVVASIMTCYCAGLSIEAIYVATPVVRSMAVGEVYSEAQKAARRFIPKPYVLDGAELGRISPLPNIQRLLVNEHLQWLPRWIRGHVASDYWTIWNEPGVLFIAVCVALTIQRFEGMIWRKRDLKELKAEFEAMNQVKQVEASEDAVVAAAVKATEYNAYGMGGIVGTFCSVVVLYGLEFSAFFGSFSGSGSFGVNTVYGVLTIFGFELFDRLSDDVKERG
ncbi:MAG: hypothetical protein QNJ46_12720 [Leptolyngbyaceae cyanobacterium MO_188.B28]|nr:hypothetical protein [Leptolyngbyaceae cyanobacterium MO_188.B28]